MALLFQHHAAYLLVPAGESSSSLSTKTLETAITLAGAPVVMAKGYDAA